MTCQHDPTYRIENDANGGIGCPLCNHSKRVVMVQHISGAQEVAPEFGPQPAPDADYERMSAGLPDGIVEHDDVTAGMWK